MVGNLPPMWTSSGSSKIDDQNQGRPIIGGHRTQSTNGAQTNSSVGATFQAAPELTKPEAQQTQTKTNEAAKDTLEAQESHAPPPSNTKINAKKGLNFGSMRNSLRKLPNRFLIAIFEKDDPSSKKGGQPSNSNNISTSPKPSELTPLKEEMRAIATTKKTKEEEALELSKQMETISAACNLDNIGDTLSKLEQLSPVNMKAEFCDAFLKGLDNKTALALVNGLLAREIKTTTSSGRLLRGNTIATKFVTSFQNKLMPDLKIEISQSLKQIKADNTYDKTVKKEGEVYDLTKEQGQKMLLTDLANLMASLSTIIKPDKIPAEIKEMNKFIKETVDEKFPGEGQKFSAQLFVLRYLSPQIALLGTSAELPESIKKKAVKLAAYIQIIANFTYEKAGDEVAKNPFATKFKKDLMDKEDNLYAKWFKQIAAALVPMDKTG